MQIRIKSFDHRLADASVRKIVALARQMGADVRGPVPLPAKLEPYVCDQASGTVAEKLRVYPRVLHIVNPSEETMSALQGLSLPVGVTLKLST